VFSQIRRFSNSWILRRIPSCARIEFRSRIWTLDFPARWFPQPLTLVVLVEQGAIMAEDRMCADGERVSSNSSWYSVLHSRSCRATRVTASAFLEADEGPTRACR